MRHICVYKKVITDAHWHFVKQYLSEAAQRSMQRRNDLLLINLIHTVYYLNLIEYKDNKWTIIYIICVFMTTEK